MSTDAAQSSSRFAGRTAWTRSIETPLRSFLRTETGGAALLLAGAAAALVWANVDSRSYESVWSTTLSIKVGSSTLALSLRGWVNSGLMTAFFFVVGLEARREFDLGELRDRRRLLLPMLAGLGGAAATIGIYLAFNAGRPSAHGWGAAMSTDTAFALGLLALVGPRFPDRLRAFMLTVVVVDDVVALVVIGFAYSGDVRAMPLVVAVLVYGVVFVLHRLRLPTGIPIFVVAVAAWVAMEKSGVEPAVLGLALGLLPYASPVPREKLERATERFREFREQPTAELASSVAAEVRRATPRNERLQQLYHPWTSYGVVPLFALANAGIPISGGFLARAFTSSVTLGIVCGYLVGKPLGILFGTWLAGRVSGGRLRPLVGWAAVGAAGTIAGVGFTVSLLIATLAFRGSTLEEAKLGILSSAVGAALLTWLLFRVVALLPKTLRLRALLGTEEAPLDLYEEIDADHDHIRGPIDAPVTVVEYGDFECPYCGQAEPIVRELLRDFVDVRYVWRHLPLTDVHPHAQLAAEAAEAAAEQGAFWEMHDLLLDRQDALELDDLVGYAAELGLDVERFRGDLESHAGASRIAADVDSADLSGVSGTPTFFINGRRHYGAYDIDSLSALVRAAGARAVLARS